MRATSPKDHLDNRTWPSLVSAHVTEKYCLGSIFVLSGAFMQYVVGY